MTDGKSGRDLGAELAVGGPLNKQIAERLAIWHRIFGMASATRGGPVPEAERPFIAGPPIVSLGNQVPLMVTRVTGLPSRDDHRTVLGHADDRAADDTRAHEAGLPGYSTHVPARAPDRLIGMRYPWARILARPC